MKTSLFANVKKLLSLLLFLALSVNVNILAQDRYESIEEDEKPSAFWGLGLMINEGGIGGAFEIPLVQKLYFNGNAGLGSWGYKLGLGLTYYESSEPYGSGYSIGYSHATGLKDFETELEVEPNDQKQDVMLDLLQTGTVNFIYSYSFRLRRTNKFVTYVGYALPVKSDPYKVKSSGVKLNSISEQVLDVLQPGGVILGFRFMFGR